MTVELLDGTARWWNTQRPLTHSLERSKEGLAMDATHTPEEWRPVVGFEGLYEVSNAGQVRSLPKRVRCRGNGYRVRAGRILRQTKHKFGYGVLGLWKDDQQFTLSVHVIVLTAFRGPRPPRMVGCHNDGDPSNNRIDNLRWDTQASNIADSLKHGRNHGRNKTHCPRRHEYTESNTITDTNGWRKCRICANERKAIASREYRRRQRLKALEC